MPSAENVVNVFKNQMGSEIALDSLYALCLSNKEFNKLLEKHFSPGSHEKKSDGDMVVLRKAFKSHFAGLMGSGLPLRDADLDLFIANLRRANLYLNDMKNANYELDTRSFLDKHTLKVFELQKPFSKGEPEVGAGDLLPILIGAQLALNLSSPEAFNKYKNKVTLNDDEALIIQDLDGAVPEYAALKSMSVSIEIGIHGTSNFIEEFSKQQQKWNTLYSVRNLEELITKKMIAYIENTESPEAPALKAEIELLEKQRQHALTNPSHFTYRALTANCGNDAIGVKACTAIVETLKKDNADFIVINCQEVHFSKTKKQLEALIPKGYQVSLVSKMPTHTKLSTQFNSSTGMATYVVHKKNVHVNVVSAVEARNNPNRLTGGSAYNKGGLITHLELSRGGHTLAIQTVSGHLDASSASKRTSDWHTLNQEKAKANERIATNSGSKQSAWDQLVRATPALVISGYDANTRNKMVGPNTSENDWMLNGNSSELQALAQLPLGGLTYSDPSTYKSSDPEVLSTELKEKRKGYSKGGMLDFVGIEDGLHSDDRLVLTEGVSKVTEEAEKKGEPRSKRDHDVIISPKAEYNTEEVTEFQRVRGHLASRLDRVAPELAKEIRQLPDTDLNKALLAKVYKELLAPDGILNQMTHLHAKKLACFNAVVLADEDKKDLDAQWFVREPWLNSFKSLSTIDDDVIKMNEGIVHEMERVNHINNEKDPTIQLVLAKAYKLPTETVANVIKESKALIKNAVESSGQAYLYEGPVNFDIQIAKIIDSKQKLIMLDCNPQEKRRLSDSLDLCRKSLETLASDVERMEKPEKNNNFKDSKKELADLRHQESAEEYLNTNDEMKP